MNSDSDGDGLIDGSDESHLLISGAFPNYEFTVIRPNVEITGSYLRLISPSDCTIEPAADEITANTARFAWTFNSRTPSGTFNFGQISPVVQQRTVIS